MLGGWRTEGANSKVATDKVWRVVNSRWAELPPLLEPRAAAAAAVVDDRIIVTGGVNAAGELLTSTEVFDGGSWKPGAPIPTPRQMLGAASDGKLVYALGGSNGTADLATVESYDPAADAWTSLPELPGRRSDFGVATADGTAGARRRRVAGRGPQERGRTRPRHPIVEWLAGLGDCAPRHGGGGCREDHLRDRRRERRRRLRRSRRRPSL